MLRRGLRLGHLTVRSPLRIARSPQVKTSRTRATWTPIPMKTKSHGKSVRPATPHFHTCHMYLQVYMYISRLVSITQFHSPASHCSASRTSCQRSRRSASARSDAWMTSSRSDSQRKTKTESEEPLPNPTRTGTQRRSTVKPEKIEPHHRHK